MFIKAESTLRALIHLVAQRTNVPMSEYVLKSSTKLLDGMMQRVKLNEFLSEGSVVALMPRLCGGALLGKPVKGRSKGLDFEEKFMRQREYDAQNQKYQAARNELKQRMEQEKANSRMNRLKIQNQWRKIMRLAKVESLRMGIEVISQNHERDVDRKDAIIQMLDRDLEEAEDQFQMALRSHLQNMDQLIDLQDSRLLASEQAFEQELRTLEAEFQAEKEAIVKQHAMDTQELNDIMVAVDTEEQERDAVAKQEHEQLREEIRNKNLEEINMLRIGLDSQIEDLEQHFETAHLNYLQTTDQRTHDFKYYTKKDQELSKEIEIKIRKIERLQTSLHHWRTKLMQHVRECSQRNRLLLEEKVKIQGHFQELKSRMNSFRQAQGRRLAELTQDAHQSKQKLAARITLAERILVLAELGRKMETEQEKVIPFQAYRARGVGQMHDGQECAGLEGDLRIEVGEQTPILHASTCTSDGQLVSKWCHLDNFLRKYNKVLLDKLAIERERECLQQENSKLQTILRQYFDGVSVNDAVMHSANPLFVINGRLSTSRPVSGSSHGGPLTVVDANHMVTTSRVNTGLF